MPWARHSAGSCGGMALALVSSRKNASILPAGANATRIPCALADARPDVRHAPRRVDGAEVVLGEAVVAEVHLLERRAALDAEAREAGRGGDGGQGVALQVILGTTSSGTPCSRARSARSSGFQPRPRAIASEGTV